MEALPLLLDVAPSPLLSHVAGPWDECPFGRWLAGLDPVCRPEDVCRPKTVRRYVGSIRKLLEWAGERPLNTALVREWGGELRARGIGPNTTPIHRFALGSFCEYLKQHRLLRRIPVLAGKDFDRRPRVRTRTRYLERDEAAAIWNAALDMPEGTLWERFARGRALAVLALAATSLRRGAILALEVGSVREDGEWQVYMRDGKGGQDQWLPLAGEWGEIIAAWLAVRAAWCREHDPLATAMFPSRRARNGERSTRMTDNGIEAVWEDVWRRSGLRRRITLHGWRHFCATEVEKLGGAEKARAVLGHSSVLTTQGYIHSSAVEVREVMREYAQVFSDLVRQGRAARANGHARAAANGIPPIAPGQEAEPPAAARPSPWCSVAGTI